MQESKSDQDLECLADFVDTIRWTRFVESLRASEEISTGGFLENRYSRRPGTNGTAAGMTLSLMLEIANASSGPQDGVGYSEKFYQRDVNFLAAQQADEGGWLAASGAPMADLLSTFSALFVLRQSGWNNERALTRARAYAQSLECEDGGFVGFALEQQADCEYTFYGLGVLALTQS
jgi:geranylgeranyl transferase type-2 subunit beta